MAKRQDEVKKLTSQELRWLLEGLSIQQPKALNLLNRIFILIEIRDFDKNLLFLFSYF